MEKLQPIIKQIFWILFGLAVMLILIGWWFASGDLAAQIEDRRTKVEQAFQEAGKPVQQVPNPRWTQGAQKENEEHEEALTRASERLREDQLEARVYPESISDDLNRIRFRKTIESQALRERFGELYRSYFRKQLEVIDPYENGDGLVVVNESKITQMDERKWRRNPPTSKEVWDALEDMWLLRSIYDSIAMVNRGAERIDKAPLRELMMLKLRGGDPDAEPGGGGGAAANPFGGGMEGGMEGGMGGFGDPGYPGAGAPGAAAGSGPWTAFVGSLSGDLLTEEFGADSGGGGLMGGGGGGYAEQMGGGESGFGMDGGAFGGGATATAAEEDRYVHDEEYQEDIPYRTRAFLLQVKIVQQDIPKLLAELTNSKFPVEIVRVDVAFGAGRSGGATGGGGGEMTGYGSGMEGGEMGGYGAAMGGQEYGGGSGGFGAEGLGGGGFGAPTPGALGGAELGGYGGAGGYGATRPGAGAKKPLTAAEQARMRRRAGLLAEAMNDDDLSIVRVAGLMTLYRSPEENAAEAAAEVEAETEAEAQSNNPPAVPEDPATTGEGDPAADTTESATADAVNPADGSTAQPSDAATPANGAAPNNPPPSAVESFGGNTDPPPDGPATTPDDNSAAAPATGSNQ